MKHRVRIFDYVAWQKVGHDVGDNSQFYVPGTVIVRYKHKFFDKENDKWFTDECTVVRLDDGRIKHGIFWKALVHLCIEDRCYRDALVAGSFCQPCVTRSGDRYK